MPAKSDEQLHQEYGDLLPASRFQAADAPGLIRLIRDLDAGYTAAVPSLSPPPRPAREPDRRDAGRGSRRRHLVAAVLVAATFLVIAGVALALQNITNLGKPTNTLSSNPHFPLSGFHRVGTPHMSNFRVELIVLEVMPDDTSRAERWPVVKALDQFGTFSNIQPVDHICMQPTSGPYAGDNLCTPPSYDWSHATYRSPYVDFQHRDLIDAHGKLHPTMTAEQRRLFDKYVATRHASLMKSIINAVSKPLTPTSRQLPLVYVGGYVQTVSQDMNPGVLLRAVDTSQNPKEPYGYSTGVSFDEAQNGLITGVDPPGSTGLNAGVNGEANIITALICHSDNLQPAKVCGRPAIRQILSYVK
jgi:hypothetical protein